MSTLNVVCPSCQSLVRVPEERLAEQPRCPRCKAAVLDGRVLALDRQTFDRHTQKCDLPILVDFWAPWCGPCRMMAPVLDQAAAKYATRLRVGKVNTDEEPQFLERFAIRGIPTLILLKAGRPIARQSGAMDLSSLERWLAAQLPRPERPR